MSIEGLISNIHTFTARFDEDGVDRLHTLVTSNVLLAAAGIVAMRTYAKSPIECTIPSNFPESSAQVKVTPLIRVHSSTI
ncbi:unnamed protein product [Caenorhabditis auriculariae]|uniref:Uncharacterized protein n=1 Tax=Caenorhabditis auriculariae TaxID=2777116 RepID=A0A8S1H7K9_9PELO|nr:unnamed protein product [Caenorhabditis auriculariae]